MAEPLPILIVDDQDAVREALGVLLDVHGIPYRAAHDAESALAHARHERLGAVIQDMNFDRGATSGDAGIALFRALRDLDPDLPVLLITAWTSLETAVQLVKEGATDYLAKPWDDRALIEQVRRLRAARLDSVAGSRIHTADLGGMVVASEAMRQVVELALSVAAAPVPVLITGPNGSGKEMIADLLHRNAVPNADDKRPFVKVNVGALPADLMEAELFGAEAGAYTGQKGSRQGRFEAADGGTLFLDEVDALPLAGQVKLLRVLESGELQRLGSSRTINTSTRVISATNADLDEAIRDGHFRQDLYFRLNVVEIAIPPLAQRTDDILPLTEHLLERFAAESGAARRGLSSGARQALLTYDWPGNVRELRNRLQRASLVARGPQITAIDLDLAPATEPSAVSSSPRTSSDDPERHAIEVALRDADGVVTRAAASLGISRQALYRKMDRLGIVLERRPRS
ncbi:MAG: sigma-54 dependent transcriptional regulator [Acidobacteriota bacterium]